MRSLGVIFLSDVVGYSKMMTDDETGTLNLIREFQKDIIKPTLAKYEGNMIKSCLLYTSPSPRDAHESRMPSSA